eukprot:GHVL01035366.1.p1 GENE.GHVL01035366.1~~GHVL01035366.1.p1  ORF type:complete len:2326 (+),score=306.78 GHVL01035366.1:450-7427(+)
MTKIIYFFSIFILSNASQDVTFVSKSKSVSSFNKSVFDWASSDSMWHFQQLSQPNEPIWQGDRVNFEGKQMMDSDFSWPLTDENKGVSIFFTLDQPSVGNDKGVIFDSGSGLEIAFYSNSTTHEKSGHIALTSTIQGFDIGRWQICFSTGATVWSLVLSSTDATLRRGDISMGSQTYSDKDVIEQLSQSGTWRLGCESGASPKSCFTGSILNFKVVKKPLEESEVMDVILDLRPITQNREVCGNGIVEGDEECDDKATTAFEGGGEMCDCSCKKRCPPFSLDSELYQFEGEGEFSGSSRNVTCKQGLIPIGDENEQVFCSGGQWTVQTLICSEMCPDMTLNKGFELVDGRGSSYGSHRTYACDEENNYGSTTNESSETLTCNIKGAWSTSTLQCKNICSSPTITTDLVMSGSGLSHGSRRDLSCASNHDVYTRPKDVSKTGSVGFISCFDGKWSIAQGICYELCEEYKASLGYLAEGTGRGPYSTRLLKCTQGFARTDAQTSEQMLGCMDGDWTKPTVKCAKSCEEFVVPHKGMAVLSGEGLYHSATRLIQCTQEYSSSVKTQETIICSDGVWNNITLDCNANCEKFPDLGKAYRIAGDEEDMRDGAKRILECNRSQGYSSVSLGITQQQITCISGEWTHIYIKCEADCEAFEFPNDSPEAYRTYPPLGEQSSSFAGSVVVVSCSEGYSPVSGDTNAQSSLEARCIDGKWTGGSLECAKNCPSLNLPPEMEFDSSTIGNKHGSKRLIKCSPGHSSTGPMKEELMICSFGEWSARIIVCKPGCGPFHQLPMNAYKVAGTGDVIGSRRIISCQDNYSPRPDFMSTEVINCNGDSEWDAPLMTCIADCPIYPIIGPSYVIKVATQLTPGTWQDGDELSISCAPQHGPSFGTTPTTVTCSQGKWQHLNLQCTSFCPDYPILSEAYEVLGAGNFLGSAREVKCSAGYSSSIEESSERVFCDLGRWKHKSIICRADCPIYTCPGKSDKWKDCHYKATPESTADLIKHGQIFELTCAPGYTPSHESALNDPIQCIDGRWSHKQLVCELSCPLYHHPGEAYLVNGSGTSHSSTRTIACNNKHNFFKVDENMPDEETVVCLSSKWTKRNLECKLACPPYLDEDNIDFQLYDMFGPWGNTVPSTEEEGLTERVLSETTEAEAPRSHASFRRLQCRKGLSSIESGASPQDISCVDGQWMTRTLICKKTCAPFLAPHGYSVEETEENNYVDHGMAVIVKCSEGYSVSRGAVSDETLQCNDGNWSILTMSCSEDCPLPPEYPEGVSVSGGASTLHHFSSYSISCNAGYTNSAGPPLEQLMCTHGINTNSTLACSATCPVPPTLPVQYARESAGVLRHGTRNRIACSPGHSIYVGPSSAVDEEVCVEGTWSHLNLKCSVNCLALPNFEQFIYAGTGVTHGSITSIFCRAGYSGVIAGETSQTLNCSRGRWDQRLLTCLQTCSDPLRSPGLFDFTNRYSISIPKSGPQLIPKSGRPYPHGIAVSVTCSGDMDIPYRWPEQENRLVCYNGRWSVLVVRCKQMCPLFPILDSSLYHWGVPRLSKWDLRSGSGFRHGMQMIVTCSDNASILVGKDPAYHTCSNGRWSGVTLFGNDLRTTSCARNCEEFTERQLDTFPGALSGYWFEEVYVWKERNLGEDLIDKSSAQNALGGVTAFVQDEPLGVEETREAQHKFQKAEFVSDLGFSPPPKNDKFVAFRNSHGASVVVGCRAGFSKTTVGSLSPERLFCAYGMWQVRTIGCQPDCRKFVVEHSEKEAIHGPLFSSLYHVEGGVANRHGAVRRVRCSMPEDIEQDTLTRKIMTQPSRGWNPIGPESKNVMNGMKPPWSETVTCQFGYWSQLKLMCRPQVFFRWTRNFEQKWQSGRGRCSTVGFGVHAKVVCNEASHRPSDAPADKQMQGYTLSAWLPHLQGRYRPLTTYLHAQDSTVAASNPSLEKRYRTSLLVEGDTRNPDIDDIELIWWDAGTDNDEDISVWDIGKAANDQNEEYVCTGTAINTKWKEIPTNATNTFYCVPTYCAAKSGDRMMPILNNDFELQQQPLVDYSRARITAKSVRFLDYALIVLFPIPITKDFETPTWLTVDDAYVKGKFGRLFPSGRPKFVAFTQILFGALRDRKCWERFKPQCAKDQFSSETWVVRYSFFWIVVGFTSILVLSIVLLVIAQSLMSNPFTAIVGLAIKIGLLSTWLVPMLCVASYYIVFHGDKVCDPFFMTEPGKASTCHWKFCALDQFRSAFTVANSNLGLDELEMEDYFHTKMSGILNIGDRYSKSSAPPPGELVAIAAEDLRISDICQENIETMELLDSKDTNDAATSIGMRTSQAVGLKKKR